MAQTWTHEQAVSILWSKHVTGRGPLGSARWLLLRRSDEQRQRTIICKEDDEHFGGVRQRQMILLDVKLYWDQLKCMICSSL